MERRGISDDVQGLQPANRLPKSENGNTRFLDRHGSGYLLFRCPYTVLNLFLPASNSAPHVGLWDEAHMRLGVLHGKRNENEAALKELREAVLCDSDLAEAHYDLARVLTRTGKPRKLPANSRRQLRWIRHIWTPACSLPAYLLLRIR